MAAAATIGAKRGENRRFRPKTPFFRPRAFGHVQCAQDQPLAWRMCRWGAAGHGGTAPPLK